MFTNPHIIISRNAIFDDSLRLLDIKNQTTSTSNNQEEIIPSSSTSSSINNNNTTEVENNSTEEEEQEQEQEDNPTLDDYFQTHDLSKIDTNNILNTRLRTRGLIATEDNINEKTSKFAFTIEETQDLFKGYNKSL